MTSTIKTAGFTKSSGLKMAKRGVKSVMGDLFGETKILANTL